MSTSPIDTKKMYELCPDMVPGQEAKGNRVKYRFLCKVHGEYEQLLKSHIKGSKCRMCRGISPLTVKQMYERFPDMAPGQEAKGTKAEYRFLCKVHGEYEQYFQSHEAGAGCPYCYRLGPPSAPAPPTDPAILEKLTALGIRPRFEFLNVDVITATDNNDSTVKVITKRTT